MIGVGRSPGLLAQCDPRVLQDTNMLAGVLGTLESCPQTDAINGLLLLPSSFGGKGERKSTTLIMLLLSLCAHSKVIM